MLSVQPSGHPNYAVPLVDERGQTSLPWWRFWSQIPNQYPIVCTQATFPLLNGSNANRVIIVLDFGHTIFWDGGTPVFIDGGNRFKVVAADPPASVGWHAADGSTQNCLNADGTVSAVVLPNTAGNYFRL